MSWFDDLRPISLEEAEAEPPADRLFARPAPAPSPATVEALRRASKPPMLVEDMQRVKARQRPRAA
jgi:hypothetical protein